jgi:hypothetical protein
MDEVGPGQCGHCGSTLPAVLGRGRSRKYCDATCRSRARRARTPPAPARCSVRAGLGRCATRSAGAWYDQRGTVAAHTCAEHRELAGELLRAGMPRGRTLDRWLPANVRWSPPQQAAPPRMAYQLTVTCHSCVTASKIAESTLKTLATRSYIAQHLVFLETGLI